MTNALILILYATVIIIGVAFFVKIYNKDKP